MFSFNLRTKSRPKRINIWKTGCCSLENQWNLPQRDYSFGTPGGAVFTGMQNHSIRALAGNKTNTLILASRARSSSEGGGGVSVKTWSERRWAEGLVKKVRPQTSQPFVETPLIKGCIIDLIDVRRQTDASQCSCGFPSWPLRRCLQYSLWFPIQTYVEKNIITLEQYSSDLNQNWTRNSCKNIVNTKFLEIVWPMSLAINE